MSLYNCHSLVKETLTMKTSYRLAILISAFGTLSVGAQANLVGYYTFDPSTISGSTVRDLSGNGNNGTAVGATFSSTNGATFNGSGSSYISLPVDVNPDAMPQMTMGGWFKANSIPYDADVPLSGLLSSDSGGYCRSLELDDRYGLSDHTYEYGWSAFAGLDNGEGGGGVLHGTDATTDQWVFVAMSTDANTGELHLYVDGQQFDQYDVDYIDGASTLTVGKSNAFQEYFDGSAKDVFVYNEALTSDQIQNIRQNGIQPVPEPTSLAALGLGAVAFFRKRRRKG